MNLKSKFKLEDLLVVFIIICPILDIASFLFRNKYNTNFSISTILRPVISIIAFIIIFFKEKNNNKMKLILLGLIYLMYGLAHLIIYKSLITKCSYGNVLHEAQYIVNYTFLILNLFIYSYVFNSNNFYKLRNGILISSIIYIVSIYIAIITNTSSTTYVEGMGFKGWFESGNSLSTILLLMSFILMSGIMKEKSKKIKLIIFIDLALIVIFLTTLIGTRVGLFGFVLLVLVFVVSEIVCKFVTKVKINKKAMIIMLGALSLLIVITIVASSATISRRKHLKDMEDTIIDASTGEISNITGDLTVIRNKIINNELENDFMSDEQKQSVVDLYNISKKYNFSNTNIRLQQLIYHVALVKNQKNIILILIGNGYLINTDEMVWEMEFPAILLNFGIVGFILYMVPFIAMLILAIINIFKNIRKINTEIILLVFACTLIFVLSTLSGYTFFNSSSMIIIVVTNIMLKIKSNELRGENN